MIILCAVRMYLRYPLSYQDVVDLFSERGLEVDHSAVFRWVQKFGPKISIRFGVGGTEFVADLICERGMLAFIEFDGDIYDVRRERDIEVIHIDTEPAEIDRNGNFVRSLA